MELKNHFDPSRFWLLLKMDIARSKKGVLMTIVILIGLLFFVGLLVETILKEKTIFDTHPENYACTLMIGGFVLSSLAFSDLSSTLKRYNYLTLPASNLEKFISQWLLTSFGWMVVYSIVYAGYTLIANAVGPLIYSHVAFPTFDPLGDFAIETAKYYFVLQGIFLVGAVHFKGYALPKTLFVLVVAGMVLFVISFLIMRGIFIFDHECSDAECVLLTEISGLWVWLLLKGIFWWILAPLCWVVAYLGLKDQEA